MKHYKIPVMQILGIDVGGSGIKGAIVDTSTGELITENVKTIGAVPLILNRLNLKK